MPTSDGSTRELLRQVVVLGHSVPGVELRLHAAGGEVLEVGRHADADLTPCQVRKALLAAALPGGPDCFRVLADVEIGGILQDLGGGFCRTRHGDDQRWFATCLHPKDVASIAGGLGTGLPPDAMQAGVIADRDLGASAVRVQAACEEHAEELDAVARALWSACLVEELYRQAFGAPSPSVAAVPPPRRP